MNKINICNKYQNQYMLDDFNNHFFKQDNPLITNINKEYFPAFMLKLYPLISNISNKEKIGNLEYKYMLIDVTHNMGYFQKTLNNIPHSGDEELEEMLKFEVNYPIYLHFYEYPIRSYRDCVHYIKNYSKSYSSIINYRLRKNNFILSQDTMIFIKDGKLYPIIIPVIKYKDIYNLKRDYVFKNKFDEDKIKYWFDPSNLNIIKNKSFQQTFSLYLESLDKNKIINKNINLYDLFLNFDELNETKSLSDIKKEKEFIINRLKNE